MVVSVCMFFFFTTTEEEDLKICLDLFKVENSSFPVHNLNGFILSISCLSGPLYSTVFGQVVSNSHYKVVNCHKTYHFN